MTREGRETACACCYRQMSSSVTAQETLGKRRIGGNPRGTVLFGSGDVGYRIPYALFRHTLSHKAEQLGIPLTEVPPQHTSQTCPRCGHVSKQNRKNWRQFRCVECDFTANADRVASVNICRKANQIATYLVTKGQNLPTGASVSRLDMQDEEASWQREAPQSCKITISIVGS